MGWFIGAARSSSQHDRKCNGDLAFVQRMHCHAHRFNLEAGILDLCLRESLLRVFQGLIPMSTRTAMNAWGTLNQVRYTDVVSV